MNLDELNKVARAMVAPGKGILAADESSGTIKKRFDAIGVESTEDSRRDYREMLFRSAEGMKHISGVILYDETIWQKAKDGTPLVDLIKKAGALPGIKVDEGTKPLPMCPGEVVTVGLDKLADRLPKYYEQGARFAKWRAVIDIGAGIPTQTCIHANAHALARYAALCQAAQIVPIVEPEVLMDGGHDIGRCVEVSSGVLKETFKELYLKTASRLRASCSSPTWSFPARKARRASSVEEVAEKTVKVLEDLRPGRGRRHRLPVRRAERRGGYRPSRRHEQDRQLALGAHLLLWPRVAARAADHLERQDPRTSPPPSARFHIAPR